MKKFWKSLRMPSMKINKNKKILKRKKNDVIKKKEQQESCENAKICYICKEKLESKYLKDKNNLKLEIIVNIQGNIEVMCTASVI